MYSASPAASPYINASRQILNPPVGQNMGYAPQIYQRENGFQNYGFQPENQEIVNPPGTNIQYYANVPSQTLHVPNTTMPRSVSDTAIHKSYQLHQDPHTYQLEVPYVTSHVLPHALRIQAEENLAQATSVNSSGFNDIYQDLSFPIPRANVVDDKQSYM